ncbi:IS1182 family transposase [Pelotomaculum isophthalicicum JI]|uniref:IS1182 family transposase n=1 Tax=Pelotomaculum isophthalicicum JI TaxID=947010 RepID=A0A9X4JWV9_9FIRM|nr:IS1182 family transposase [Pelotomaculum isophthalicicum]MDF9410090.1 IS1182 family transposase [Pelotomaculum isophthalicicum JI]
MLGHKDNQLKFTDIDTLQAWEQKPIVPEDSVYYGLSQANEIFKDELFADAYSFSGRPSIPPSRLIKVLLLQFYDKVSDREAENRARYDLRWKVALGISIAESGFNYSALSRFRARLLLHQKERIAFEEILDAVIAKELLPGNCAKQIIDSTYVLGAGAVQDTYTLIRMAIKKLQTTINKRLNLSILLPKPLNIDYQSRNKPKINWEDPVERNKLLNELCQDALQIIEAVDNLKLTKQELELRDILTTIAVQDIEQQKDGTVKIKQGVAKDRLISTNDPEMRHGRKSSARKFDGYKTHTAMETDNNFITEIEVTPGNVHDSEAAAPLVDRQPEERKPDTVLCDMAYGTGQNREDMEKRQVKIICPVPTDLGRNGCFPKSAFTIDLDAQTCQCPAGKIATEKIYDKKTNRLKVFVFSQEQCQNCPLLNQCTKSKKGRRTITINQYERHLQEARIFQQTEEFKNEYPERCKIENKQAEMVHHGLRQARYIGKAKVYLQSLLIGAIVNFKRYWKLVTEQRQLRSDTCDTKTNIITVPLPLAI